ncbi:type III secretion protein [Pseudomonas typographi]|uniref:Type III secretion protein n=1 Tax=Pseudomonas typographi TaxID=2715964 RepID=A0ABR7Z2U3_9PSED|nr:type III secretion protein [Pseudomonas typographi]MBD1554536.1 type III secretion protein [Pseudomonas typographi]MBD1589584.1 type III secretion protein [Pseudomonas typographi]MBD1599772.1 type III secretion protein [Pseudomonas typographi]
MLSMKSLQNRLDHAYKNAQSDMDDAEMVASESGDVEDMRAFNDASSKTQVANTILNESLRAKHGITKAIIDGIQ